MKLSLWLGFLLCFAVNAFADQAAEYLKQADEYNKKKDFANAEKYYFLAEGATEKNAFYLARRGQFYHFSLKDFVKAVVVFEAAYQKGFSQSWLFVQAGNSYRFLGDLENSEKWFRLGISNYRDKMKSPKLKPKDKDSLNEGLQMLYSQYLASLLDFKEIKKAQEIGKEAYGTFPDTCQNSLLNYLARTWYWLAVESFGNAEIKAARDHLNFASTLVKRDLKLKAALLSEFDILLKVLKTLESSQNTKPLLTHKILVVILEETDASDKENRVSVKSRVSAKAEKMTALSVRFLKNFIEGSTAGNLKIDYAVENPGLSLKRIKVEENIETEQRKNRIPDIDFLVESHEDYFKEKLLKYDTLVFIWSAKDFNVANGGQHHYFFPKNNLKLSRGFVHITSERIVLNGPDLLLHEFFHTIERMADIQVTHGYYKENRHYYSGWKGENGNDYYFWHLNGKKPEFYKRLHFMMKNDIIN